jgi:hypothetical protein
MFKVMGRGLPSTAVLMAGDAQVGLPRSAIAVRDVTLIRRTQEEFHYDLKRSALRLFSGRVGRVQRRTVIDGVSLRIEHGEKVGIIGPNGSGKSTLLKLVAGILAPTNGTVGVDGTIAPLIELGVGFDLELSLVDNIVYYGALIRHGGAPELCNSDRVSPGDLARGRSALRRRRALSPQMCGSD